MNSEDFNTIKFHNGRAVADNRAFLVLSNQPIAPDRRPVGPKYQRSDCEHSPESIDLFLRGQIPRLGSLTQDRLAVMRRFEQEILRAEAKLADLDEEIDRKEIRSLRRHVAWLKGERDFERESVRVYLAAGDAWGEYDRTMALASFRDGLIHEAVERGEAREAGGDTPTYITSPEVRARIETMADNRRYCLYAEGVAEKDDAKLAYGLVGGCARHRLAAAVQQHRAGLEVRVTDL